MIRVSTESATILSSANGEAARIHTMLVIGGRGMEAGAQFHLVCVEKET